MRQYVQLGFTAEDQVGFDEDGTVVMKEKGQKTLHQFKLQNQEMNVYQKDRSYDFPPGANDASIRSLSEMTVFLQDKYTATLKRIFYEYSRWGSYNHEGIILNCFGIERVYALAKSDGEYEIILVDKDFGPRIQPVAGKPAWKDPYLSVCSNYGKMAVASTDNTLDIYRRSGK